MRGTLAIIAAHGVLRSTLVGQLELPTTVVEADRWAKASSDAGPLLFEGAAQDFTREEIQQSGATSVLDFLSGEAGVPFTSLFGNSRSGTPSLRGFAGGSLGRVLVLSDGLPINRPDIASPDWGRLPLSQLEGIRVLRGSRTVRYGGSALGGVIELETRRDATAWATEIEASFGNNETQRGLFSLQSPGEDWGLNVSGESFETAGYRDNSGREDRSLLIALQGPLGSQGDSRWTFSAGETRFENPGGLDFARFQQNPRQSSPNVRGFEQFYLSEIETRQATQSLRWNLARDWSVRSLTDWSRENRGINDGGFFADNALEQWRGELVALRDGAGWDLEFGLRWQAEGLDFSGFRDLSRSELRQRADLNRKSGALFAINEWNLGEGWTLRQGLSGEGYYLAAQSQGLGRFASPADTFDEQDWGAAWASETAIEYEWAPDSRLWLRHERVYRFPLLDEIAGYQGVILDVPFNAELKPEEGDSFEIGLSHRGENLRYGLVGYGAWLGREIAFQDNLNRNLAPTERWGLEMNLGWGGESWAVDLRYDWTHAQIREGEFEGQDLPLVPRHRLSGVARWQPAEDWEVNLNGSFNGSSIQGDDFGNELRRLPAYPVFGMGLTWKAGDQLQLFARVSNLLDRNYATFAAVNQFYPAPGREWLVGARAEF